MNLTNTSIAQLYTIQPETWKLINTRVGFILYLNKLANTSGGNFTIPWPDNNIYELLQNLSGENESYNPANLLIGIFANNPNNLPAPNGQTYYWSSWVIDTNLPTILPVCQTWSNSTFNSLINLATQIQTYATGSANNFSQLNQQINNSGGAISPALQQTTVSTINTLSQSTNALITATDVIFADLQNFLSAHQAFESFLTINNFLIPLMKITEVTPAAFSAFEGATETVIGTWDTIKSNLSSATCTPADVTNSFLESLNIEAAINQWNLIAQATGNFISFAGSQSQFWNYTPATPTV
ncbi:MAG: hypothetical protein Q8M29_17615 [Bacteroidota bacterium]|nr:hypothetical protein [Bacteroidota bacterium]